MGSACLQHARVRESPLALARRFPGLHSLWCWGPLRCAQQALLRFAETLAASGRPNPGRSVYDAGAMNTTFRHQALRLLGTIAPGLYCEVTTTTNEVFEFVIRSEEKSSDGKWSPEATVRIAGSEVGINLASDLPGCQWAIPYPLGVRDARLVSRVWDMATRFAEVLEFHLGGV